MNRYAGEGANGGCYFEVEHVKEGRAILSVGWSCVRVHDAEIPVTWLSEIIAIASAHKDGIAGFLKENDYGGGSYALACDPAENEPERKKRRTL